MLQNVFNMFVDIPESLAINIPGLRDPKSLPHLKRVRQKIKNKLKVAKAQLKCQQEIPKKAKNSPILNDNHMSSNKEEKGMLENSKNICSDHIKLSEKSRNLIPSTSNSISDCVELTHKANTCTNINSVNDKCCNNKLFNNNIDDKTQNEFVKNYDLPLSTEFQINEPTCSQLLLNINSEENDKVSDYNKIDSISQSNVHKSTLNTQISNKSK